MNFLFPLLFVFSLSAAQASQQVDLPQEEATPAPLAMVLAELDDDAYVPGHNVEIDQRFERGEAPQSAVITVKVSGFLDDSVSGYQVKYDFAKQDDRWVMIDKTREATCQPGRAMASGRCS